MSAGRPKRLVALDAVMKLFAMDEPWSVLSVLEKLEESARHLLRDHDCDHLGWELLDGAARAAREIISRLAPHKRESSSIESSAPTSNVVPCAKCGVGTNVLISRLLDDGSTICFECEKTQVIDPAWDARILGVALPSASGPPRRGAAVSLIERIDEHGDVRMFCVWNIRYQGWSLPGGLVEDGEIPEQAQRRELYEETGCETLSATLVFEGEHGIKAKENRASRVRLYRVVPIGELRDVEGKGSGTWLTRTEFLKMSPFAEFYRRVFAEVEPRPMLPLAPVDVRRAALGFLHGTYLSYLEWQRGEGPTWQSFADWVEDCERIIRTEFMIGAIEPPAPAPPSASADDEEVEW